MTQSFKHYLVESKKTYSYKVGLAGDLPEGAVDRLETVMQKFKVSKMSKGKKTPIQERPLDFPNLQNTRATYFDVETEYPTTPAVLEQYLQDTMGMDPYHVIVRDPNSPQEQEQAPKDNKPYEAMLNSDYEASKDQQKSAGDSRVMELLKELEKARKERPAPDAGKSVESGKQEQLSKTDGDSKSPIQPAHKGPVKGNPQPGK